MMTFSSLQAAKKHGFLFWDNHDDERVLVRGNVRPGVMGIAMAIVSNKKEEEKAMNNAAVISALKEWAERMDIRVKLYPDLAEDAGASEYVTGLARGHRRAYEDVARDLRARIAEMEEGL